MHLCIDFQESYKRLDCLCKDYLSSQEGVSEYIRQMENTPWIDRRCVISWEDDYKRLKHVRWVRNQLAHEIGTLEAGICTIDDLNYIKDFYNRILRGNDPFTLMRKTKETEREQQKERQHLLSQKTTVANKQQQKRSLWDRIVAKIKNCLKK